MFSFVAHVAICSNSLPYGLFFGLIIGDKICYSADKLNIACSYKSVTFAELKLNLVWKLS
jgi:hypothetical protein